jgi:hypothetical protein
LPPAHGARRQRPLYGLCGAAVGLGGGRTAGGYAGRRTGIRRRPYMAARFPYKWPQRGAWRQLPGELERRMRWP